MNSNLPGDQTEKSLSKAPTLPRPKSMPDHPHTNGATHSRFYSLATFVLVVGILKWGREVAIPVALAALLAFLLYPAVKWLTRLGLGQRLAVVVTSTLTFLIFCGLAWVVTVQALNVVQELPRYETNIEAKLQKLQAPHDGNPLSQAANLVERIQQQLASQKSTSLDAKAPAVRAPVPVEVEPPKSSIFDVTRSLVALFVGPLGTAALVGVFMVAMLVQHDDLRARIVKLAQAEGLDESVRALEDAAHRVSRYLLMQLIVNASYGIPVGLGLYFLGIPNASLWALLSTLLRFIPYIGVWIAAAFPVAFAFAIDPGWTKLGGTLGLFMVAEAVTANIAEPWIYGVRTGISGLALMVAAVFWTWLWGPAGLFLSTPLTVCFMVMGKYFPGFEIFSTLLSNEPLSKYPGRRPRAPRPSA